MGTELEEGKEGEEWLSDDVIEGWSCEEDFEGIMR